VIEDDLVGLVSTPGSDHLDQFAAPEADALIFTGSRGGILRRSNFRRAARWDKATRKIGFPGLHFHDLRHTGNTIAASSGASLKDLMQRMGHDSARAALIYQHSTAEADRKSPTR
jgi:integrase